MPKGGSWTSTSCSLPAQHSWAGLDSSMESHGAEAYPGAQAPPSLQMTRGASTAGSWNPHRFYFNL